MIIKGYVTSVVNVRTSPNTSVSSNVARQMYAGQTFEGSTFVKDSLNRDWILLTKIAGDTVSGLYLADFINSVVSEVIDAGSGEVPSSDGEYSEPPVRITTVEEFMVSGVLKKRTTIWENPKVIVEE